MDRICHLKIKGEKGQKIKLIPAEKLSENGDDGNDIVSKKGLFGSTVENLMKRVHSTIHIAANNKNQGVLNKINV